jgi:hypothetical protein
MLLVLIAGIVIIKRSMARLLGTATNLWGAPPAKVEPRRDFGVHLAPTLGAPGRPVDPHVAPSKP